RRHSRGRRYCRDSLLRDRRPRRRRRQDRIGLARQRRRGCRERLTSPTVQNMPINPDAVGYTTEPRESSWNSKDCLLYAIGVGAGVIDPTGFELEFTTENSQDVTQRVLPTFPVVVPGGAGAFEKIGSYNPALLVHGEQSVALHGSLPVEGRVEAVT